jgi:spore coat polysaccharide biosynthesis protein SpsF
LKTAVIITARLNSSRLPEKILLPLNGKTVLEHLIDRALVTKVDEVILAIPNDEDHKRLAEIALAKGIKVYGGSLNDRLDRIYRAADFYGIEAVASMDGDDPFCDPYLMERGLKQLEERWLDAVTVSPDMIVGAFTLAVRTSILKKAVDLKDGDVSEDLMQYIRPITDRVAFLDVDDKIYYDNSIRLTLDYQEDYEFFKKVFEHLEGDYSQWPLTYFIDWISRRPEIKEINAFRRQNWIDNKVGMK